MKRSFFIALIFFICFSRVFADNGTDTASIEINLASRILSLYKEGMLFREYPVCVGKQSTQTPKGTFRVINKVVNPHWINKGAVVPPGPQNPLGIRWMGITKGIGIHGNNKPSSIGTYASAGCIRMYNRDVEEVYSLVELKTPVTIKYERVKIFEDKYSGEKAIIIYPDSYKKGGGIDKQLSEKLNQEGISGELMIKAEEALVKPAGKPVAVCYGMGVFLNDNLITCDALVEQGEIYVNHKAAGEVLGLTAETAGLLDISIKELEGRIYINLTQAVKKLGGGISYDEASRNAYISMKFIKINGVFAGINQGDNDKSDFLAVEAVKQLGYEYSEDSVDLRIFGNGIMKLKRKNIFSIDIDNLVEALGGSQNVSTITGIADVKLPAFLRFDEEYFKTENIDGKLMISAETANSIREKTGWDAEAFSVYGNETAEYLDVNIFLEDYAYVPNIYNTVIDISVKQN